MTTEAEGPGDTGGSPAGAPSARVTSSVGPAGYVVRPARPVDAPGFLELFRGVVAEGRFVRTDEVRRSARFFRRQFRRSWTTDQVSLVAVAGGRVIGHLNASREDHPVNRHVATLGMTVAAGWRGVGVGSALMAEAIRWGRETGVEKLALAVYPDNDAGLALYRKFGFQEEGRLTGFSKKAIGYRDEILMGLWLAPRPGPER